MKNFFKKLFDTPIIIHRNQLGLKVFTDIRHLVAENGPFNPLVNAIIMNATMGLPIAFADSNGDFFFSQEEDKNNFFIGHETGHVTLNHLQNEKGLQLDLNNEIQADRFAVENGYCSKEEAIEILESAKSKLYGGFWKWLLRVTSKKGERVLEDRIAALKAL